MMKASAELPRKSFFSGRPPFEGKQVDESILKDVKEQVHLRTLVVPRPRMVPMTEWLQLSDHVAELYALALLSCCNDEVPMIDELVENQLRQMIIRRPKKLSRVVEVIVTACHGRATLATETALKLLPECIKACPEKGSEIAHVFVQRCSCGDGLSPWAIFLSMEVLDACPHKGDAIADAILEVSARTVEAQLEALRRIPTLSAKRPQDIERMIKLSFYGIESEDDRVTAEASKQLLILIRAWPQEAFLILSGIFRGSTLSVKARTMATQLLTSLPVSGARSEDNVLKALSDACSLEDAGARAAVMEYIPALVKHFPTKREELSHLMLQGSLDRSKAVRSAAVKQLASLSDHPRQMRPEIVRILLTACSDGDNAARSAALKTLSRSTKNFPDLTEKVHGALVRAATDNNSSVRESALAGLCAFSKDHPGSTGDILDTLVQQCIDTSEANIQRDIVQKLFEVGDDQWSGQFDFSRVFLLLCNSSRAATRVIVLQQMKNAFSRFSEKREVLFAAVITCCTHRSPNVRKAATIQAGELMTLLPQKSEDVISVLIHGCSDRDPEVRAVSAEKLISSIESIPCKAEDAIKALALRWKMESKHDCTAAIKQFASLGTRYDECMHRFVDSLLQAARDEDETKRAAAMDLLWLSQFASPPRRRWEIERVLAEGLVDRSESVRIVVARLFVRPESPY